MKTIYIRVEDKIHASALLAAKQEGRSLNNWLTRVLNDNLTNYYMNKKLEVPLEVRKETQEDQDKRWSGDPDYAVDPHTIPRIKKEKNVKVETGEIIIPIIPQPTPKKGPITPVIISRKDGTTIVSGHDIGSITKTAKTIAPSIRFENGVCKVHGTPLDSRGKCLQKGCKYA